MPTVCIIFDAGVNERCGGVRQGLARFNCSHEAKHEANKNGRAPRIAPSMHTKHESQA